MKRFAVALAGLVLLGACSSGGGGGGWEPPAMTSAQQRMASYVSTMQTAGAGAKACSERLLADRDNAAAAAIFPLHDSNSLTVAQLSSAARPTQADLRRIVAFKASNDRCLSENLAPARALDPAFYGIVQQNMRENDLVIADMARNRLNLGDANRRMQSEDVGIRRQFEVHVGQVRTLFAQQHQAELQQRQAAQMQQAAEMQALNQSLQQFNNQLQQQTQQQQLLNAINRPRTATCNGFGYSVSCTSY
jgi:hypothetical protein